jgi:hypothetical protein
LFYLGYHQCNKDEYSLGSKCIKIFQEKHSWNNAQEKCLSIGSHLIYLNDIVQEKKLAYFLSTIQQQTSFWISDEKDKHNGKKRIIKKNDDDLFISLKFVHGGHGDHH